MSKHAFIDKEGNTYYPVDMFKYFDNFPFVVRFDSKVLKTTNNADKIRKKLNDFGLVDCMVYALKKDGKKTNYWEIRTKSETDRQLFIKIYNGVK